MLLHLLPRGNGGSRSDSQSSPFPVQEEVRSRSRCETRRRQIVQTPYMVSLRITNACNHRCSVCGQYGAYGYMGEAEKRKALLRTLPVEIYKKMVDDLAFYQPVLYATGGEPFLYPGLVELLNYAKAKGSPVFVVTNGVKLQECAEEMVRNEWDLSSSLGWTRECP